MAEINTLLKQGVDELLFTAAALSVYQKGNVVYEVYVGKTGEEGESVNKSTLFDLASLTKPLSTTLITLLLFDQQILTLDAPLGMFLPSVKREIREITLLELLTHTSGLPPLPNIYPLFPNGENIDEELAQKQLLSLQPEKRRGEAVLYSCSGFLLLGEVLKAVTGSSLRALHREIFSQSLGVPGLSLLLESGEKELACETEWCCWRKRRIKGDVHDENSFCFPNGAGNAGLFGTLRGVTDLGRLFLEGGVVKGRPFIKESTLSLMMRPAVPLLKPDRSIGFEMAAPHLSSGTALSSASFGHTGFTGTSFWVDPQRELLMTLLTNRVYYGRQETADRIALFRRSCHQKIVDLLEK